ncbi:MFS general substrate transporter [Sistotremastrum suecicum HHB10207 ss-3]|uniref:MFS general substrate transporter n=1 Tax=Sistotremastrum suecicum HHB10207 ss-3 TaxID=1314776 RepID=A0A166FWU0_9AGAM|nr:MFS general substrate transporter [Sistotremastrum suecicum HHB10207 ss-3]
MSSVQDLPVSETTPLLAGSNQDSADAVYERFSFRRKQTILAIVSACGLLTYFTSSSFTPTIPQIAHDLETTGSIVNISVGIFVFFAAFGSLFWSRYSGYYGRQPIYVISLPIYFLASIGVAACRNVPELMIFRALQAFGSCAFQSVGAGTISDIFRLDQRGRALGIFYGLGLSGPALAPVISGMVAERFSWRVMQASLGVVGLIALVFVLIFLPETSHPGVRGIDHAQEEIKHGKKGVRKFVLLNPLSALALMKSPVVLLSTLGAACAFMGDFIILIPLAYTLGKRYGIENKAVVGAMFLPSGLGNTIGAPLAGWVSDYTVMKWREYRGGKWIPEDRLRASWHGALLLVPLSTLGMGLAIQFIDGIPGLSINLILLFIHGVGMSLVFAPCSTYSVDVMHDRSAEVVAANVAVRNILVAFAVVGALPCIETFGILFTNTMASVLGWIGFAFIAICIRYGPQLRAWSSISHTDAS